MKVIVFEPDYDQKHQRVLRSFKAGIPGSHLLPVNVYSPCDIAVIFGMVKKAYQKTWTKQAVIDRHKGRALIVVESAFVKREQYWAIGFGGQHGNAEFPYLKSDPDIHGRFNLDVKPWRINPNGYVVVFGQLQRDTNVQHTDHYQWCRTMVSLASAKGHKVLFRPHPRELNPEVYGIHRCFFHTGPLEEALGVAKAGITYNSTSAVDCAISGVPFHAYSPSSYSHSISTPLANLLANDFLLLERDEWLKRLGYSQWSLEEMKSGKAWNHLSRFLNASGVTYQRSMMLH